MYNKSGIAGEFTHPESIHSTGVNGEREMRVVKGQSDAA